MIGTNYKITNIVYCVIAFIISYTVITFLPINSLCYDVFGYYIYLPLKFKYNDLTLQNFSIMSDILNKYHNSETFYQALKWEGTENWVMRYPIGLAVLFSPFYFIADFITPYTTFPADGFSRPYQLSVLYGSLLYALIGLYFMQKTLKLFFDDYTAALTLLCIVLGTNFFLHVSMHGQGTMSHNFIFVFYSIIIYLTIKWHQSFKWKYIVFLGLSVGLIALCRPTEIISVLIPLLYGITNKQSFTNKIQLMLKHKLQLITFSVIVISVGFIQFGYWYSVSGKFIINPYDAGNPGEGIELLQPHILKVLFSFRKGWFVYTPLMLFTVLGFWQMYKNNKTLFTPVFIYFILNLYIVSCWSCWWYGACFGVRSLVPSYAALCFPLGYFVVYIFKNKLKMIYMGFLIACVALSLFQSWQMSVGILDSTNMSRAYYFSTFLQTTPPTPDQTKLLLKGKFVNDNEVFTLEDSLTHSLCFAEVANFETPNQYTHPSNLDSLIRHSGKTSLKTNPQNPYTLAIEPMVETVTKKSYCWVKSSVWVYSVYPADSLKAGICIELKHKGRTFKFRGNSIKNANFKPNVWNKIEYYFLTPDDLRSTKDLVRTFFWNNCNKPIYVDDLMLEAYEPIIDKSVF